ncbi:triose-phosphate isomerase [archaeon]|nr:triose-phosphate isomerase [archaeon]
MIIVNFKTYHSGTNALKLAEELDEVADNKVLFAVQATDIRLISQSVKTKILAQHVDPFNPGRNTGSVLPRAVKDAGAVGSLINHSEKGIVFERIIKTIKKCRENKLKTIVCVPDLVTAEKVVNYKPSMIAFEDPALISTGKSISTTKPDKVKKFASLLKGTGVKPLCGAGISTKSDVKAALKLGVKGVLAASAVAKAKNPASVLKSFLEVI